MPIVASSPALTPAMLDAFTRHRSDRTSVGTYVRSGPSRIRLRRWQHGNPRHVGQEGTAFGGTETAMEFITFTPQQLCADKTAIRCGDANSMATDEVGNLPVRPRSSTAATRACRGWISEHWDQPGTTGP